MKKFITVILALSCILTLGSCKAQKQDDSQMLGSISKTDNSGSSFKWDYADQSVMSEFDSEFADRKAKTEEFYSIPAISGITYYISSVNGNDNSAGMSPSSAWKSCRKLSNISLRAGDAVLFECGSIFREQITLVSGVTYASYGSGAKPEFYGSIDASAKNMWSAVSGVNNLYVCARSIPSSNDIGEIIFNGGEAYGIKIQKLLDADKSLALENASNGMQTYEKIPSFPLKSGKDIKGYNLAFYHDSTKIYLYCEGGNPADVFDSIELSQYVKIFSGNNISNVTIANINFKYAGTFAIRTMVCDNLVVKNCGFEFIGGSIAADYSNSSRNYMTRYGNAIENWNGCKGMTVEYCYFNQIYDTAVTTQSNTDSTNMENVSYRYNVMENLVYGVELWSGEGNSQFNNVTVSHNICRNIGYGMTTQRPDKVEGFISAKGATYVFSNASITDNIIVGSIGWLLRTNNIKTNENANGYTLDRNTYVNTLGNAIGMLSDLYPKFSTAISEYKYDYETVKKFCDAGVEQNGKFYYTVNEGGEHVANMELLNSYLNEAPFYEYTSKDGDTLPFRLIFPKEYDDSKQYKLLTYFNYEYAGGTDNVKNVTMSPEVIASAFADGSYIILVPQAPSGNWTNISVENGNYSLKNVSESTALASAYGLIHDVALEYGTSGNYCVGVSSGGYAVSELIARYENLFKASVIVSGAGDVEASIGETKVWIIHGEGDEKIPASQAKALADAWDAEYTEVSRELHDCWKVAFVKEDIVGWLNQQ